LHRVVDRKPGRPAQITIYNKKIVDQTVTADGISGNLADVYIQI
jgi:hypothetical protein